MRLERVLCAVDFSEFSKRALHHAEAFANWYDAELHVVHVQQAVLSVAALELVPPSAVPQSVEDVARTTAEALETFIREAGVAVPARRAVLDGPIARSIASHAAEIRADILVAGTHGRSGFQHALIGSTAERLLHKAPCPVLTVPPAADEPGSADRVRLTHVLCGLDFSPSSLKGLALALSLAQEHGCRLSLVHVVEVLSEEEALAQASQRVGDYVATRRANAKREIARVVPAEARSWCDVSEVVELGSPAAVLLRLAEDRAADMIVLGSQGRGPIGRALFGSTTQSVVRHATCPVLTARGE